jgi:DICT domain-containing protein
MLAGSILQKLRDTPESRQDGRLPLSFGVYYKNTLVALCHALEDAILSADYSPLMLAAFQQGKWYLEEADRYADLAAKSQQVVIMAAPDAGFSEHPTGHLSNVALVSLESKDPVAQEWHLIILSPNYSAMVLCQELSEADYGVAGVPEADLERKFYGLWTFEPRLVQEAAELTIAHIGFYDPDLQGRLTEMLQSIQASMQTQLQHPDTSHALSATDNLGDIVARVVDYLQTCEHCLPSASYISPGTDFLDQNLISNELQAYLRVAQLIDQTDLSNPMAAAEVATLAETMGQLLDLPSWQLHRLRLAGLLHRIVSLTSIKTELAPGTSPRYGDDPSIPLACPLVPGTQILRKMQRLKAIATILNHQNEWWDGSGSPAGLAGDEIPLESRILGLVAHFQYHLVRHASHAAPLVSHVSLLASPSEASLTHALANCQAQQGDRWDPKLIDTLSLLVNGLKQGFTLPINMPHIASGLWLLDSHSEEAIFPSLEDKDPKPTVYFS